MTSLSIEQLRAHLSNCTSREYRGHKASVHCVGWNCDGSRIATGSTDSTFRIWTLNAATSGSAKESSSSIEIKGHSGSVDQVAWSPINPDLLATASADRTLRIWDAKSGLAIHKISTNGEVLNLVWSPDGCELAAANKDDVLGFWEAASGKFLRKHSFSVEVNQFIWANPSTLLVTTGLGTVEVFDFPSLVLRSSLQAHTSNCYCIDKKGNYFAVGAADALVSIWDLRQLACIRTIGRLEWPIRAVSFSFDNLLLASASEDQFIDIACTETGVQVYRFPLNSSSATVNSLAWHPKKPILAYVSDELDPRSGRSIGVLRVIL